MSKLNKFRSLVRDTVKEVLKEMTATGNVAGYNTPYAFTGGTAAGEAKRKRSATNSTGFMVVDDFEDDEDTADTRSIDSASKPKKGPVENRKKSISVKNEGISKKALPPEVEAKLQMYIKKFNWSDNLVNALRDMLLLLPTPKVDAVGDAVELINLTQSKKVNESSWTDTLPPQYRLKSKEDTQNLSVAEKHQLKIARATLKMNAPMVGVMGGMSKEEARKIIGNLTGIDPVKESVSEAYMSRQEKEKAIKGILTGVSRKILTIEKARELLSKLDDRAKESENGLNLFGTPVNEREDGEGSRETEYNKCHVLGCTRDIPDTADTPYCRYHEERYHASWSSEHSSPTLPESINEGKYHNWRNDPTLKPKQKIGRAIREANNMLGQIEEMVASCARLKTEAGVQTGDYWKNTNKALLKIESKLVRVINNIKNVR